MSTKQRLFLTAEMCLGMGSIMSLIGNLFSMGLTQTAFNAFLVWWVPTVIFAFGYNLLVATNVTNFLIRRYTRDLTADEQQKRGQKIRSWTMIVVMCFSMCTWGLATAGAFPGMPITAVLIVWARSFVLAYIVRGLFVKPVAMRVMLRVVPNES